MGVPETHARLEERAVESFKALSAYLSASCRMSCLTQSTPNIRA